MIFSLLQPYDCRFNSACVGNDACIPVSKQKNRQEYLFVCSILISKDFRIAERTGVSSSASISSIIVLPLKIRLKKETEQVRFFDCKADIIHSNPEHSALFGVFYIHQIVRMINICLFINCSFQFFNRCKMIHYGLCGTVQPFRNSPCVDVFCACFTGNRQRLHQQSFLLLLLFLQAYLYLHI